MAKKVSQKNTEFSSNPFKSLKGFAVSAPDEPAQKETEAPAAEPVEAVGSFADEMALLGVQRFDSQEEERENEPGESLPQADLPASSLRSEDAEFLQAMEQLQVRFSDQLPEPLETPSASPRRMKMLKQGKLTPDASLDLHGLRRDEVGQKLGFFLQNAQHQGLRTLLIITGKGLHSESGEALLRSEAERFLANEGGKWLLEWGRAPKQYGGAGALVLFLRKNQF